jgi:hypothetical protein
MATKKLKELLEARKSSARENSGSCHLKFLYLLIDQRDNGKVLNSKEILLHLHMQAWLTAALQQAW